MTLGQPSVDNSTLLRPLRTMIGDMAGDSEGDSGQGGATGGTAGRRKRTGGKEGLLRALGWEG